MWFRGRIIGPCFLAGNDVKTISASRERLGVFKMANTESTIPFYYLCSILTFHLSGTVGELWERITRAEMTSQRFRPLGGAWEVSR
jgi:hypothetical protein